MFFREWNYISTKHDDVIKWKHFPRYWPFVRGNHRSPVNSPRKGQLRGALMFSFICAWMNAWVNNCEADDLRRYRAHYDLSVMSQRDACCSIIWWMSWLARHFLWTFCCIPNLVICHALSLYIRKCFVEGSTWRKFPCIHISLTKQDL